MHVLGVKLHRPFSQGGASGPVAMGALLLVTFLLQYLPIPALHDLTGMMVGILAGGTAGSMGVDFFRGWRDWVVFFGLFILMVLAIVLIACIAMFLWAIATALM